jgi:hypothetical protein
MTMAAEIRLVLGDEIDPETFRAEAAARYCLKSFPPGQDCSWFPVGAASMVCSRCGSVEVDVPRGIIAHVRLAVSEADARHEHDGLLLRTYRGLQRI